MLGHVIRSKHVLSEGTRLQFAAIRVAVVCVWHPFPLGPPAILLMSPGGLLDDRQLFPLGPPTILRMTS